MRETSQISRISVDPKDGARVVVAALGDPWHDSTERGIFSTTDGGKSWRKTLYGDASTGAADVARDPSDPSVLYAAMWHFRRRPWIFSSGGGPGDGLYKSVDGGATWRELEGGGFPAAPRGRIGVAISPSKPGRVYAVVQSAAGTVWRSDDAGRTWTRTSANTLPEQRPFYFSHLAVDPKKPDRVISASMYLTESKNGGRTWKHVTGALHPDNHALWWSHDGTRLIDGNDGGVAISRDGGASWAMPLNFAGGQVYHVGYDLADPYTVCGGFQDNSSWCAPSNARNGIGILDRDWYAIAAATANSPFLIPPIRRRSGRTRRTVRSASTTARRSRASTSVRGRAIRSRRSPAFRANAIASTGTHRSRSRRRIRTSRISAATPCSRRTTAVRRGNRSAAI
ncbi:MAG: hypothetical protein IAI48_12185 [Candidatus Eremiobacteraeota bacterium]|nr:hypothetical protein [Candidatus Eremiobacteraeota bacterium]